MIKAVRRGINGAGFALALALVGCSSPGGMGGMSVSPGSLLAGGRDIAAEEETARRFAVIEVCPEVQVRQGTELLRQFERGRAEDPSALTWQADVRRFSRECSRASDGGTIVRVGVAGRMISGPGGFSGTATLPVRVALLKDGGELLYSQMHPVSASIAPGTGSVGWSQVVDGISIPPQSGGSSFVIYVGFDETAR
jgi:hypothetical protein